MNPCCRNSPDIQVDNLFGAFGRLRHPSQLRHQSGDLIHLPQDVAGGWAVIEACPVSYRSPSLTGRASKGSLDVYLIFPRSRYAVY
ncbi:MAG: hypothetical protein NT069_02595 [Planctomycetota bacterium]|nr:hypothetical protein [Planctomycetota bacterium]